MKDLELLVVIINYKTAKLVIDCLETLLPQLDSQRQAVVVDNASRDGSAEEISEWILNHGKDFVGFIQSSDNSGFSGGNNQGIKFRDAEFYLLANSDTLFRENSVQELVDAARNNPQAGMVSPRLEWPDGTPQISCFRFHTPISEFVNTASTAIVTRLLSKWNVPIPVQPNPMWPQWTSFACVLLKRTMIEDIGLMDEGYFLYYEDVDYSRTAFNKSWKILHWPQARVVHLRGGSSDVKKNISRKARLPAYVHASRARYFTKHYGYSGYILANLLWHMGAFINFSSRALGKKASSVCEHQWLDIWTPALHPLSPYRKTK